MAIVSKFGCLNLLEPSGPAVGLYRDTLSFTRRHNSEECFVCDVLIELKKRLTNSCTKLLTEMKFGKTVCYTSDVYIAAVLTFCLQHLTTRQPMYWNLILRRVRATIVVGKSNKYDIF